MKLPKHDDFNIAAVRRTPQPRYPGCHEPVDLAPAVRRWFSPVTLALAGLSGLCLPSLQNANGADDEEAARPTDKQVQQVIDEYLKNYAQPDSEKMEIRLDPIPGPITANPAVRRATETWKEPQPIGDNMVELSGKVIARVERPPLDVEKARAAACELFKLYGVELKQDVTVTDGSVKFEADGYNASAKIGFELIQTTVQHLYGEVENTDKDLVPGEYGELTQSVEKNKNNVLVIQDADLGASSISEYSAMKAFLQSVADYLEWLKKSGRL